MPTIRFQVLYVFLVLAEGDPADTARRRARGQCWASLMQRTFGFDVLACPRGGGRLRLIALIEQAAVIQRILRHLGLPDAVPAPRPARAPPLPIGGGGRFTGSADTDIESDV